MTNTNEGLVPTTEEVLSAVQYAGYVAVTENGYEADQAYLDRLAVLFNIWLNGVKQEAYEAGQRDAAESEAGQRDAAESEAGQRDAAENKDTDL